jgi:hypothetical protein
VAGSRITFAERGSHVVDTPTGEWPLFAVAELAAADPAR